MSKIKALENILEFLQKLPDEEEKQGMGAEPLEDAPRAKLDVKLSGEEEKAHGDEEADAPKMEDLSEDDELESAKHNHESSETCGDDCPVHIAIQKTLGKA